MTVLDIGQIILKNEAAMKVFAEKVASCAAVGDVICLFGDLGAGKTSFARFFIRCLTNVDEEVPSPTYTLAQNYQTISRSASIDIWHYDLYRISDPSEVIELGIEEAVCDGIVLVEWPEIALSLLPSKKLEIYFEFSSLAEKRIITLRGSEKWRILGAQL
jgi:tRNA threonylcarbamoyl adenosine modification protein YjeE